MIETEGNSSIDTSTSSTLRVTRIVHASVLLDFNGKFILTDPWFSQRPGYYWGEPLGMTVDALPRLDAVVSSHIHYDHYDIASFASYTFKEEVPFAVKLGMARIARDAGFKNVVDLDTWQSATLGPFKVTATPAKHSAPENTYIIEADGLTVFFGGDTLLIPELKEVAHWFTRIDVALLPVNGLEIRPLFNHKVVMNDGEAAELCAVLHPRLAIPIHYAFTAGRLRDRLLLKYTGTADGFARSASELSPETTVKILSPGQPAEIKARKEE
jgi:L-ascorbate metabolism protein UlaG (beta-lactamase superfamily)